MLSFVCSCCLLITLMSSESQGSPERPKARPHRCNARVEDLLQVRPAAHCCVIRGTQNACLQLLDACYFSIECIAQHRPCSHLSLGPRCGLLGETCESASSLSQGKKYPFVCVLRSGCLAGSLSVFWICRQEPTQAYLCVKDPDLYLNPDRMTYQREWSQK